MYHLVAQLLPWFAALYLLECLVWPRRGSVLFVQRLAGGFRRVEGRLQLVGLLPWQRIYAVVEYPFLLDAEGVWLPRTRELTPGAFYSPANFKRYCWDELPQVELDHRRVRVAGESLFHPSAAQARTSAVLLEGLRRLQPTPRAKTVEEWLVSALCLGRVEELEERVLHIRRPLDWLCGGLFFLLLGPIPASLLVDPWAPALPWLLLLLAGLFLFTAGSAIRTARSLQAAGIRTDGLLLPLVLSPPSLVRAALELSVPVLQGVDAAAVAVHLLDRGQALATLRRELHAARYAASAGDEAWCRTWAARSQQLEGLAAQAGIPKAEVLAPPPELEEGATAFCPLCQGSFYRVKTCPSCSIPMLEVEKTEAP